MPQLHVAKINDCISSIALEYGFFPDTLWNDPDNADLRRVRPDPNVLRTGDLVVIPDKRCKEEDKSTDQRHRFRRKGFPTKLHIRILKNDKPRANEPYQLVVDGRVHSGKTNGEGRLWIYVPANAHTAMLYIGEGEQRDKHELVARSLQPVTDFRGIQQRLNNLGYRSGLEDGKPNEQTTAALKRFQKDNNLPITGECDTETQAKLRNRHGS